MSAKQFRLTEVSKHNKEGDMWLVINQKVYDVSQFASEHPGGVSVFASVAGDDATNGFNSIGHSDSAKEDLNKFYIGEVHPDDVGKLKTPIQGTKSNVAGIGFVFVLLGACFFFLLRSLVSG